MTETSEAPVEACWYDGIEEPKFLGLCPTEDGAAGYEGFLATLEDAFALIRAYQNITNTRFVIVKQKKSAFELDKHKVFWEEPKKNNCKGPILQYDGIPFVIRSSTTMECQFGRDRHIARKKRLNEEVGRRSVKTTNPTRKQNCTAAIFIREICRFPQFQIPVDTPKRRFHQAKKLRQAMINPSNVTMETRIYVRLPRDDTHSNHPVEEASLNQPVDPQVKNFVRQQISAGVSTVSALQQVTETYVEQEIFRGKPLPSRFDRRYFPGRRYYTNMLYRARHSPVSVTDDCQMETVITTEWDQTMELAVEGGAFVVIDAGSIQLEHPPQNETKLIQATAVRCRDVLNQLVDLTYRCTDVAHLEALEQRLSIAQEEFLAGSQMDTEAVVQVPLVARWESVEQSDTKNTCIRLSHSTACNFQSFGL